MEDRLIIGYDKSDGKDHTCLTVGRQAPGTRGMMILNQYFDKEAEEMYKKLTNKEERTSMNIKEKVLNKLHKGENIIYYKRSRKNPIIGQRIFHDTYGYCIVTKVWNIKERCKHACGFNYEKDDHIKWAWKVEFITDIGKYILSMSDFLCKCDSGGNPHKWNGYYLFYK